MIDLKPSADTGGFFIPQKKRSSINMDDLAEN